MQGRRTMYRNTPGKNYRSRNGSGVPFRGGKNFNESRRNHYDSTNKRMFLNYSVEEIDEEEYGDYEQNHKSRERIRKVPFGNKLSPYGLRNQKTKNPKPKKIYSHGEGEDQYLRKTGNRRSFTNKHFSSFNKKFIPTKLKNQGEPIRRRSYRKYEPGKGKKKEETKACLSNAIGRIYPSILQNFRKNGRYTHRITENKDYKIVIYLVRHAEALHNKGVIDNPDIPRYEIYKDKDFVDCKLSEGGYEMCNNSPYKNEKYYQEIQELYKMNEAKQNQSKHTLKKGGGITKDKNDNFMVICSPLKRCLETLQHYLNIKKNVLIYEPVRETAGAYYSDERSSVTDVKKYCEENFEDYEILCFGENDLISGNQCRETRTQVESRCLQFLQLVHSSAVNYFAYLEKQKEGMLREKRKTENNVQEKQNAQNTNESNLENTNKENNDHIFHIVLVSHSSYIAHLLALLDFFELNERVLKNCEIKKISIPLSNLPLFQTDSTKLQMIKPSLTNTIPVTCGNSQKMHRKMHKNDKYIFTIHTFQDLKHIECLQCCTVIIYRYDNVSIHEKNQKTIKRIQAFLDKCNENKNEEPFSNGIYKKHVMENPELGRKLLVTDGSNYIKYSEEHNIWEITQKGYFLRQNVVIIVLPYVQPYSTQYNRKSPNNKINTTKATITTGQLDQEKNTENEEPINEEQKLVEMETYSQPLEKVKEVINLYNNISDLVNSKQFWMVIKENIKEVDLYKLQQYLVNKFNTLINNEAHVCYLNLTESLNNEIFMNEHQNKCNGYLKNLKEKYDKKIFIDFEKECRYINENLLSTLFFEYASDKNNSNNENEEEKEKEMNHAIDKQNVVKRKFIYIPNKSEEHVGTIGKMKEKEFVSSSIKLLRTLPTSIQNLNVELFHQDGFWYIHCLHKFIKSKNKKEGIVFAKLLCSLDLLKSYTSTNKDDRLFQKLTDVEKKIHNSEHVPTNEKNSIFLCEDKFVESCNTQYCSEGIRKYKKIQNMPGKTQSVIDELNHLRQNILTVAGGAEHVFILNIY